MATPPDGASSSSSSSRSSYTYDVFLSFRGEDTRNNFTGFLHSALEREGINVFIDSKDLWGGEEIQPALFEAIRGSKISITVFSKGYADSKWCLRELVKIVECHRSNGQTILPLFLDVEPTEVRNQKGSFEGSFQKHKENFDGEIEDWKAALTLVGANKGYELKQVNGNQSELVKLVVLWALSELITNHLVDVKNPIGLDARVDDLLSLLNVGSMDVRFVGICGIGGIGKTSIAMTLYNRILERFKMNSFLANVREEASRSNGIVSLQQKLIYDVSKKKVEECNVYRGQQLIKERLQGKKVLLVLDDVDSYSQLKDLAIEFNLFGPGSRIIITSRDEHILNGAKVDEIYRPEELDDELSLQLFSLNAFSKDQPPEDYKQLSHDVLRLAGGLPLTLEVLGSHFSDITEKEEWQREIEQLKRIPHEDVLKKLQISFDNLKVHEKSLFLDAACFFIGWRKETVISLWDACGFDPIPAIKKLTQRSLLKFTKSVPFHDSDETYDELSMHDQIQAMGRGIVLEESPMEFGERSRLWSHDEILEVLEEHKVTQKIEGILLPPKSHLFDPIAFQSVYLKREDVAKMSKLRFLSVDGAHFEGNFPHLSSTLNWFSWRGCPLEIIPSNFYHKKLVHMDLSRSRNIRQAWTNKPLNESQMFQKLKVLRLWGCTGLSESPDFSWFPYLETLDLGSCLGMVNLHKSIGDLKSLVKLYLNGTKIEELPNSTCRLSSLKILNLHGCESLKKLPESIGDLKSLIELYMNGTKIEELPNSTCRLSSLKILYLNGCELLNKLPESIGDLKSLVELYLNGTKIEELPNSTCRLSSLKILYLNACESLNKLPESIGDLYSLVNLGLDETKIKELPNGVGLLEKLEVLMVGDCHNLDKLPIFGGRMRCLREIRLTGTSILLSPDNFLRLPNLEHLKIGFMRLKSLPQLPSTLIHLEVSNCISLQKFPDLSSLKNLKEVYLYKCKSLEDIQGLVAIESLDLLKVYHCNTITDTPRKIHGQGALSITSANGELPKRELKVNDGIYKGLILCVVLELTSKIQEKLANVQEGEPVIIPIRLIASIRRKDRSIRCEIEMTIEGVEFTTERDIIYIHHCKGFDWFGFPLEGADAIEDISVKYAELMKPDTYYWNRDDCEEVKFWKLLLESTESEQQMPNQESSAKMVADFFRWSYYDHAGRSLRFVVPEEVERSNKTRDDDDHLSCSSNTLIRNTIGGSNPVPEQADQEKRMGLSLLGQGQAGGVAEVPNLSQALGFPEGMLRASKRARLDDMDDDDEAGGPPSGGGA